MVSKSNRKHDKKRRKYKTTHRRDDDEEHRRRRHVSSEECRPCESSTESSTESCDSNCPDRRKCKGPTGPVGPHGPQGPKGDIGADGATGPQGEKGDTGADGATGPQGEKGPRGHKGCDAEQGKAGRCGPRGCRGYQGCKGPTGPQGGDGPTGATGAGEQGPTGPQGGVGPEGPQGGVGPSGPTGAKGCKGHHGCRGPRGPRGIPGTDGCRGYRGYQGCRGFTGPRGELGPVGPEGPTGEEGPEGPDGPTGPSGVCDLIPGDGIDITGDTVTNTGVLSLATRDNAQRSLIFGNPAGQVTGDVQLKGLFTNTADAMTDFVSSLRINNQDAYWNANEIQSEPVDPAAPAAGDYLNYDGAQWVHTPLPDPSASYRNSSTLTTTPAVVVNAGTPSQDINLLDIVLNPSDAGVWYYDWSGTMNYNGAGTSGRFSIESDVANLSLINATNDISENDNRSTPVGLSGVFTHAGPVATYTPRMFYLSGTSISTIGNPQRFTLIKLS